VDEEPIFEHPKTWLKSNLMCWMSIFDMGDAGAGTQRWHVGA